MAARAREAGEAGLQPQLRPGRPSRLTAAQQALVPELLRRGAVAWGFVGERWTCARVAAVIRREFGVQYHPAHVSRLLDAWNWSLQKPCCPAGARDEAAIARWREEAWPALQKKGRAAGRTVIFVDEAGFQLLPAVVRTYAPRGRDPRAAAGGDEDAPIGDQWRHARREAADAGAC